jgi:hypothetical protein
MTTIDPTEAVQRGVLDLLRSDPQINRLISSVLDEMPEKKSAAYPFLAVPDLTSVPDGTHDDPGYRVTVRIHTFVRGDVRERNTRVDNEVGARIIALLDHGHRTLDPFVQGHSVWMIRHEEARKVAVPEDRTVRHRIDRVSVWTSQK